MPGLLGGVEDRRHDGLDVAPGSCGVPRGDGVRQQLHKLGGNVAGFEPGEGDIVGNELLDQLDADELGHRRVVDHGLDYVESILQARRSAAAGRNIDLVRSASEQGLPAQVMFFRIETKAPGAIGVAVLDTAR